MRRVRHAPLFVFLGVAAACSSSSNSITPTPDAGPVRDTGVADHAAPRDVSTKDTGAPLGIDASVGLDAGTPPTPVGVTIATQGDFTVIGITDDGYIIYTDSLTVFAVPEAGGTSTTILATGDAGINGLYGVVSHKNVFLWWNLGANGAGTLSVWNKSLPAAVQVSTASVAFTAATSDDSSAILFSSGTPTDGSSTAIYAATLSDLTASKAIVTGVDPGDLPSSTCVPTVYFSGSGSSAYGVVDSCTTTVKDGGSDGPQIVTSFPVSSLTGKTLVSGASFVAIDDNGTSAVVTLPSGELEIVPLNGGTTVIVENGSPLDAGGIDAGGIDAAAKDAGGLTLGTSVFVSPSDSFVLFTTAAGALVTTPLTSPKPLVLTPTGASELDSVSASQGFVLIDNGLDDNTGLVSGLALASTSAAGTPTAVVTGTNEAGLFGDAFTADSKYVVYLSNVTADDNGYNVGTLMAASVTAPTTPITLSTTSGTTLASTLESGVFSSLSSTAPWSLSNQLSILAQIAAANAEAPIGSTTASATNYALSGSQLVLASNFVSDNGYLGQVDIQFIDLSTTTAAKTVMAGADPSFVVSPDNKYIVYTISFGGSTDGIYSVAVPQ